MVVKRAVGAKGFCRKSIPSGRFLGGLFKFDWIATGEKDVGAGEFLSDGVAEGAAVNSRETVIGYEECWLLIFDC